VGQEIQSAVQAGKEVTVHEKPISAHGFTGYGYTITALLHKASPLSW
jgi:hypothetical protein